jgi:hypothetical protein
MAGAVILARAVDDKALSDEILGTHACGFGARHRPSAQI